MFSRLCLRYKFAYVSCRELSTSFKSNIKYKDKYNANNVISSYNFKESSQCTSILHRFYSGNDNQRQIVNFDQVTSAITNDNVLIIDVREPDEIKEHGTIPNSINIPLGNVSTVLSTMSEKEFQNTFKRIKPTEDTEMIFYCMIGKRSGKAQQNALNLGYKNAKNYLGSWTEWASKVQK